LSQCHFFIQIKLQPTVCQYFEAQTAFCCFPVVAAWPLLLRFFSFQEFLCSSFVYSSKVGKMPWPPTVATPCLEA